MIFRLPIFLVLALSACIPRATEMAVQSTPLERPNILIILLDDLGYSDIGAFGSEIRTPHIDKIASAGASYSQFYVYPRCSPTRAALMTGRYPHEAGLAFLTTPEGSNAPKGPYQGYLEPSLPTLPALLKQAGYGTYMSGKWHLGEAPENWPRQRGFDRYFGLISGASSYYELLENAMSERRMAMDDAAYTPPENGFYMTDAITDHADEFLDEHFTKQGDKPFFLYLAYTAPHWPLHAPKDEIDAYNGVYDGGWQSVRAARLDRMKSRGIMSPETELSAPPKAVGKWSDYTDKQDWARKMQTHAAMVTHADAGIGQIVEKLRRSGKLDNTIIIVMSDNGASSEDVKARKLNKPGSAIGARGNYVSFEKPGAFTANTPLRDYKGSTHEGAVRSPLFVSWPQKLAPKAKGLHANMVTILDIMPTVLAAAKVDALPKELSGRNLTPALEGAAMPAAQPFYWDHVGWRGVRDGQWKAVSAPGSKTWALYDLDKDPAERHDLSDRHAERTANMSEQWQAWADKVGVRPISRRSLMEIFFPKAR